MSKRVAIIGAGAAGLASASSLLNAGRGLFSIKIFESSDCVGGIWKYRYKESPNSEISSVMYSGLVTNLPIEIMQIDADHPFESKVLSQSSNSGSSRIHSPSFATHEEVQNYLEKYFDDNKLRQYTKFNTKVTRVAPVQMSVSAATTNKGEDEDENENQTRWLVSSGTDSSTEEEEEEFDCVLVCNGHYSKPALPKVQGLKSFSGLVMHSAQYDSHMASTHDEGSLFHKQRVLLVGAKNSSVDIAREISKTASAVVVSDRNISGVFATTHGNLSHVPGISHIGTASVSDTNTYTGNSSGSGSDIVHFTDGTSQKFDSIIFATGYDYDFPFLSSAYLNADYDSDSDVDVEGNDLSLIQTSDRCVRPLYKQCFHLRYPTLAFIGLSHTVIPFPYFKIQSMWVAAVLSGNKQLPSYHERKQWLMNDESRLQKESIHYPRNYHYFGQGQWSYLRDAAEAAGVLTEDLKKYLQVNEDIYNVNRERMPDYPGGPDTYRCIHYTAINRDNVSFSFTCHE
jgi:hypothetical protein